MITKPKYQIGDEVWWPTYDTATAYTTCQDCGGTKHFKVILFDGTEHTIDCEGCKEQYYGPSGKVKTYERLPKAKFGLIAGVEADYVGQIGRFHYRIKTIEGHCYGIDEPEIYSNKEEAGAAALKLAADYQEEERKRIYKKERDTRTWAWNVHYHRNCIKRAQKDLEYHTSKLNAALPKVKEEKAAKAATP